MNTTKGLTRRWAIGQANLCSVAVAYVAVADLLLHLLLLLLQLLGTSRKPMEVDPHCTYNKLAVNRFHILSLVQLVDL